MLFCTAVLVYYLFIKLNVGLGKELAAASSDESTKGTSDTPGKQKEASSDEFSEDDSVESDDYSIVKKQAKKLPDNLPGKHKKRESIEDSEEDSGESDDYSIVKKQIQGKIILS